MTGYKNCAGCTRWRPITDFPPHLWRRSYTGKVIKSVQSRCRPCRRRQNAARYAEVHAEGGERLDRERRSKRRHAARKAGRDPRATRSYEERFYRRTLAEALDRRLAEGMTLSLICERLGWPRGEHTRLRRSLGLTRWPDGYRAQGITRDFATSLARALELDPREAGL